MHYLGVSFPDIYVPIKIAGMLGDCEPLEITPWLHLTTTDIAPKELMKRLKVDFFHHEAASLRGLNGLWKAQVRKIF